MPWEHFRPVHIDRLWNTGVKVRPHSRKEPIHELGSANIVNILRFQIPVAANDPLDPSKLNSPIEDSVMKLGVANAMALFASINAVQTEEIHQGAIPHGN